MNKCIDQDKNVHLVINPDALQIHTLPDVRVTSLLWLKLDQVISVLRNTELKGKVEST